VRIELPKAPRGMGCGERVSPSPMGIGLGRPSPLGDGFGEGVLSPEKIFNF